jgi:hypothetical protein
MHEKDIELARLLVARLSELEAERKQLADEARAVQDELAATTQIRDERSSYLDVLSRAAELLNRPDLQAESPETGELEARAAELEKAIADLDRTTEEYRGLVEDLGRRAPHLLAAARGEHAALVMQAEPEQTEADEARGAQPQGPAGLEPVEEEPRDERDNEPAADSAAAEALPPADQGDVLGRFNLAQLQRREAFTHGRGAAYVIDATSVLQRVPAYDNYIRGMDVEAVCNELIRDFDILGKELTGSFHLVFNKWFQSRVDFGNHLTVEFGSGDDEGSKPAGDSRLRDLVFEMTAKLRPVCVVTGDTALADSVSGQGIHIIPLGEFFRA